VDIFGGPIYIVSGSGFCFGVFQKKRSAWGGAGLRVFLASCSARLDGAASGKWGEATLELLPHSVSVSGNTHPALVALSPNT
jgi:hypothetical protein